VAGYSLKGSYETVQVLSPTVINPVVYCTIATLPSGVIAAMPVEKRVFNSGQAGVELGNFADAIEQIMADARVISAVGEQLIDPSGLLADNVVFTVQYVSANTAPSGVTAEAVVPVGYLNFTDAEIGRVSLGNVEAIIDGVYANLQSAADG
jgi:hypothetical protein